MNWWAVVLVAVYLWAGVSHRTLIIGRAREMGYETDPFRTDSLVFTWLPLSVYASVCATVQVIKARRERQGDQP